MAARHSIKAVTRKTGISPYLLRAWERRYGAVIPERTPTNRRLYSDEDIDRLVLLYKATLRGESIGQVAGLPTDELRELVGETSLSQGGFLRDGSLNSLTKKEIVDIALEATANLNRDSLFRILLSAEARFSKPVLFDNIVIPFLQNVGERWQKGSLKVVHEHLASAVIRSFLGELLISSKSPESAPSIVSTTFTGQDHEFGAIMAVLSAISEGWRGTYLGPNLPADDIAHAATQDSARAIALSLVYPPDDPQIKMELKKLRRLVGPEIAILAGGMSVGSYDESLAEVGAMAVKSTSEFRDALREIRDAG